AHSRGASGSTRLKAQSGLRRLDRLDQVAERDLRVEVGERARAAGAGAVAVLEARVAALLHRGDRRVDRLDEHADVVEALATSLEPLGEDRRPLERLQELELRIGAGEGEPHRVVSRLALVVQ